LAPPTLLARCPAKLNLSLRVLGCRDDGYHELDTLFQAIDLWDTIEARPGENLSLACDDPSLPVDGSNLVLAAVELLRREAGGSPPAAALTLRKEIPVQAGLGGGSSDAAGALLLFNELWQLNLGREELAGLAARLGADVPFFLYGGTARGLGRGDLIEPRESIGELLFLIGVPPFGISTATLFSELRARLTLPRNGVSLPLFSAHKWQEENDFHIAVNDLEALVFESWPELESFRNALWRVGASSALLSGSGSAVYGVFRDAGQLDEAAAKLRAGFEGWRLVRTRAIDGAAHVIRRDDGRDEGG
jgi:4-diphosphocytidyl-2-C-methyl-D-erythritol kinase